MSTYRAIAPKRSRSTIVPRTTDDKMDHETADFRKIIICKLILVVLTLTCGAVLALAINLIVLKETDTETNSEYRLDDIMGMENFDKPAEYCQFKHKSSSKCLAISGTAIPEPLSLLPCVKSTASPGAAFQVFHYESKYLKIENITKPPENGNDPPGGFIDLCVTAASPIPAVDRCSRSDQNQVWYYTENGQFSPKNHREMCITITEKLQQLEMALCHEDTITLQQLICIPSKNPRRLKTNSALALESLTGTEQGKEDGENN
ncbi:unnamed protein product [Ceutorhynchus assimilis]|uniref:Uncharacterized protein n=1 Tax=Ceutorhynchus assimilis TaxID=467358 RepID=A0A9N9MT88_9CUCU|nr:unnamed protein product [Ceutorhynchus assimilis]